MSNQTKDAWTPNLRVGGVEPLCVVQGWDIIRATRSLQLDGSLHFDEELVATMVPGHVLTLINGDRYAFLWGAIRFDVTGSEEKER